MQAVSFVVIFNNERYAYIFWVYYMYAGVWVELVHNSNLVNVVWISLYRQHFDTTQRRGGRLYV